MPLIDEPSPTDADAVLRLVLEQRAARPSPSAADVIELEPRDDGRGASPRRAGRIALVACSVLVVVALVAILVQARPTEEVGTAGEGAVPPAPFAPDLTELPAPKYYGAMTSSPSGTGSLLAPGGAATREDPAAVGAAASFSVGWRYDTSRFGDPRALDARRKALRTRMSWSIPNQGGPDFARDLEETFAAPYGLTARAAEAEVDGIVFQVATNDPEVTDGQLEALLERMVAQYHRARGSDPPPPSGDPAVRLPPFPHQLPQLPPTAELEAAFARTAELDRDWYWSVFEDGGPLGWVLIERDRHAFPVFDLEGKLLGVYVSGLGIVSRAEYEAPGFDPETASSDRF